MKSLNDALNDLRDRIVEDGFTPTLTADVAEDWDVNPALLARKFQEKHGKPADQYSGTKAADLVALAIKAAETRAVEIMSQFTGRSSVPIGKLFCSTDGTQFVTVGLASNGLHVVRVRDGDHRVFKHGLAMAIKFNLI